MKINKNLKISIIVLVCSLLILGIYFSGFLSPSILCASCENDQTTWKYERGSCPEGSYSKGNETNIGILSEYTFNGTWIRDDDIEQGTYYTFYGDGTCLYNGKLGSYLVEDEDSPWGIGTGFLTIYSSNGSIWKTGDYVCSPYGEIAWYVPPTIICFYYNGP